MKQTLEGKKASSIWYGTTHVLGVADVLIVGAIGCGVAAGLTNGEVPKPAEGVAAGDTKGEDPNPTGFIVLAG